MNILTHNNKTAPSPEVSFVNEKIRGPEAAAYSRTVGEGGGLSPRMRMKRGRGVRTGAAKGYPPSHKPDGHGAGYAVTKLARVCVCGGGGGWCGALDCEHSISNSSCT